jgi:hypothetical protein
MTYDDLAKIIVGAEITGLCDKKLINETATIVDECKEQGLPALEAYKKVKPQFKEIEKKLKGEINHPSFLSIGEHIFIGSNMQSEYGIRTSLIRSRLEYCSQT